MESGMPSVKWRRQGEHFMDGNPLVYGVRLNPRRIAENGQAVGVFDPISDRLDGRHNSSSMFSVRMLELAKRRSRAISGW